MKISLIYMTSYRNFLLRFGLVNITDFTKLHILHIFFKKNIVLGCDMQGFTGLIVTCVLADASSSALRFYTERLSERCSACSSRVMLYVSRFSLFRSRMSSSGPLSLI